MGCVTLSLLGGSSHESKVGYNIKPLISRVITYLGFVLLRWDEPPSMKNPSKNSTNFQSSQWPATPGAVHRRHRHQRPQPGGRPALRGGLVPLPRRHGGRVAMEKRWISRGKIVVSWIKNGWVKMVWHACVKSDGWLCLMLINHLQSWDCLP